MKRCGDRAPPCPLLQRGSPHFPSPWKPSQGAKETHPHDSALELSHGLLLQFVPSAVFATTAVTLSNALNKLFLGSRTLPDCGERRKTEKARCPEARFGAPATLKGTAAAAFVCVSSWRHPANDWQARCVSAKLCLVNFRPCPQSRHTQEKNLEGMRQDRWHVRTPGATFVRVVVRRRAQHIRRAAMPPVLRSYFGGVVSMAVLCFAGLTSTRQIVFGFACNGQFSLLRNKAAPTGD